MPTGTGTHQLVVFAVGCDEFALPIEAVQEIVRSVEPRPVAAGEPWTRGVVTHRGTRVPVLDLGVFLGVPGDPGPEPKIVLVRSAAGRVGVVVSDVEEVVILGSEAVAPMPGAGSKAVQAIAEVGDRLILVLDPAQLALAHGGSGA